MDELDGERKRSKVARNAKQKETKPTKQFCAPFFLLRQIHSRHLAWIEREGGRWYTNVSQSEKR